MSEGFIGEGDLGTATESAVEAPVVQESAPDTQVAQVESTEQQIDVEGMQRTIIAEREKIQRLQEYNEFLRNRPDPNAVKSDPYANVRSLEKDSVPYVEDVEQLIELKMYEREQKAAEDRLIADVKTISDKKKTEDPSYIDKMNLAFELVGYDSSLANMVEAQPTAEGKLAKLEWIASAHPLYGNISQKANQQELIDRVQKNASLPPTLSSMPSLATTTKPVSQMTDAEYKVFLAEVKRKL